MGAPLNDLVTQWARWPFPGGLRALTATSNPRSIDSRMMEDIIPRVAGSDSISSIPSTRRAGRASKSRFKPAIVSGRAREASRNTTDPGWARWRRSPDAIIKWVFPTSFGPRSTMPRPFGRAPDAISRIALKALEFPSVTRKVGKVRSASGRKPQGRHLLPSEATIPPRRSLAIEPYPPFDPRFAPVSQAGVVDSDDRISDGLQERVGVTRCGR